MAAVQTVTKGGNTVLKATTITIATQNTTAGNMLVLVNEDNFGDGTATQIASVIDGVNTWQRFTGISTGADMDLEIWYAFNITGGVKPAIVVTYQNDLAFSLTVAEYSGVTTTDPKDKSHGATGTSTTPASGNTPTLSQASELILGVVGWGLKTGSASSPVTGYGTITQENNGSGNLTNSAIADKQVSATTAQSIGMTLSQSGSEWGAICVTFLNSGAATPSTANFMPFFGP